MIYNSILQKLGYSTTIPAHIRDKSTKHTSAFGRGVRLVGFKICYNLIHFKCKKLLDILLSHGAVLFPMMYHRYPKSTRLTANFFIDYRPETLQLQQTST